MPTLPPDPVKGKPVRADWGKRLLDYLRKFPLQSGPGIKIQKTGNGWTISAKPGKANSSGPRLWDVTLTGVQLDPMSIMAQVLDDSLSAWETAIPSEGAFDTVISPIFAGLTRSGTAPTSIAEAIENLFASLQAIIDGFQSSVDAILENISPISTALTTFFEDLETFPSDGDYIYNNILGIGYTVFEKNDIRPAGTANPTANLIFRVEFPVTIGEGSDAVTRNFCAITLFPAPDVGRLLTALFNYLLTLVKKVLGAGLSSLVSNVVTGIVSGLSSLYDELLGLLNNIPSFDPTYLETLIDDLDTAMQDAIDRLDALETAKDALETAIDALETTIAGSVNVNVIGADGNYHTLKVQEDTTGTSAEREITWIDSNTGYGQKSSFLIKSGATTPAANTKDVDWRQINYIHPNGTTYQMHCLVRVADTETTFPGYIGPEPINTAAVNNFTIKEIVLCEDGSSVNVRGLFMDGHGNIPAEDGNDADFWTAPT